MTKEIKMNISYVITDGDFKENKTANSENRYSQFQNANRF